MGVFKKGEVHNPKGRLPGTGFKQTNFRKFVHPRGEELIQKAIREALDGNSIMLKLFVDRLLPRPGDSDPISLSLPDLVELKDVKALGQQILALVGKGAITVEHSNALFEMLRGFRETGLIGEISSIADDLDNRKKDLPKLTHKDKNDEEV